MNVGYHDPAEKKSLPGGLDAALRRCHDPWPAQTFHRRRPRSTHVVSPLHRALAYRRRSCQTL